MDELPPQPPPPPPPASDLPPAIVVEPGAQVSPAPAPQVETLSGHFVWISMWRAFRLHIRADEVLPSERAVLSRQAGHITDPDQMAFLAWRRSIALMVALIFVPLTISRFVEAFDGPPLPKLGRLFVLLPALGEAAFCVVAFAQLNNWAQWKRQRRIMFIAWALYFIAPFVVYLYPFRAAFDESYYLARSAAEIGGIHLAVNPQSFRMVIGLAFGVQALLALGPKVISLMPGLIRASIVSKLLFPGTTAPGWLMMIAAPFYALFAYIIVLLPYQITGSWQFVAGNAGILLAQVFIGISGRRLTVPQTATEASARIHKSWLAYIGILVVSAGFMFYGLADFIAVLHLGKMRVVTSVLAVVSNVLLDTMVGVDAIIAAMSFFRKRDVPDPRHAQMLADDEAKLDVFTSAG